MNYKWETEEEKLKKYMRVTATKKLEWLEEMRQFISYLPKETLVIRKKMMEHNR